MNKLWKLRIKINRSTEGRRQNNKKFLHLIILLIVLLVVLYPQYWKRMVYPLLIGEKLEQPQKISQQDYFADVDMQDIIITKKKKNYRLVPKVAYSVTGRVGIVDNYDGWWNKIYRGHSQGDYIDLVPRDIFLVIGKMADPDIFKMFDFEHEERLGSVLCKGVKYRKSFTSFYRDEKEALQSKKNYEKCNPYIKGEEQNNYHPIPATENINRALSMLKKGDIVSLEGFLVDVPQLGLSTGTRKNQVHDNMIISGMKPGKCFVLYASRVIINGVEYR